MRTKPMQNDSSEYPDSVNIRAAKASDAEQIRNVLYSAAQPHQNADIDKDGLALFHRVNTVDAIAARIQRQDHWVYCAHQQESLIAYLQFYDNRIDQLFVLPQFQRQNIATQLWQTLLSHIQLSAFNAPVWVKSSTIGVPFYQRCGFICEGGVQTANGFRFQKMIYHHSS